MIRWLRAASDGRRVRADTYSKSKYASVISQSGGWDWFQSLLRELDGVARKHGADIATVSSRWVLDQPQVLPPSRVPKMLYSGVARCFENVCSPPFVESFVPGLASWEPKIGTTNHFCFLLTTCMLSHPHALSLTTSCSQTSLLDIAKRLLLAVARVNCGSVPKVVATNFHLVTLCLLYLLQLLQLYPGQASAICVRGRDI